MKLARYSIGWIMALAALSAVAVLYCFPPAEHSFYPRCGFYLLTGWQCPGCGGLRAAHSLLHGQVTSAVAHNPLLILLLPGMFVLGLWWIVRRMAGKPAPRWWREPCWLWLLLTAGLLFTVWRNLPGTFPGIL